MRLITPFAPFSLDSLQKRESMTLHSGRTFPACFGLTRPGPGPTRIKYAIWRQGRVECLNGLVNRR
jgi:hypothetical protein